MKQMIYRIYPPGYTGDSLGELNKLLRSGWFAVRVDKISSKGNEYNDYLLEIKNEL